MSIKKLFGKTVTNYEDVAKDVESTDFIDEVVAKRETYLPPIDFSDPANFVFYGSAELYYEAAIKRIYEDYPYDGSKAEQIDFEEKSSFLERWLFENKYPKTTGFVELGTTVNTISASGGYTETTVPEYIEVHGGLHINSTATNLDEHLEYSARYDEANNRTQNFNCDFTNEGITIEFWMKKDSYDGANKEVVLDLWNGVARGSTGYSRVFLETFDDSGVKKMSLTIASGSTSDTSTFAMGTTETNWNHYALSVIDGTSNATVRFYTNGAEINSDTLTTNFATLPGRLDGFIGAMQTEITSGKGSVNGGKLSAQLDEFRFWKTRRTSRQIKLNWFREIGGGANTDDNTSNLGVYLKFNEGITGTNSIDSTVLDYSGRLANGTWTGYPGSSARSTDSAMTLSGYTEAPTPIIYPTHPSVVSLEAEMLLSGSDYDSGRGQAFYKSLPNWLVEEDQEEGDQNLRKISHILSSYMDTLRVQIDSLSKLQDKQYISSSYKAAPFASELLKNKGFTTSEMFLSSEVFESFSSIDYGSGQFDLNIDEIKNLIYTNIYNNLENIYNTKGTEKSIRNLIRCFGVDDELIKLNQYTDGGKQYLGDKYRSTSVKKKYINLNQESYLSATMHQSGTLTFISGTLSASVAAFTMEADIVVPHKPKLGENGYFATPFLSASVMGFHEAMPTNASNFTWWATNTGTAPATGAINTPSGPISVTDFDGETITITDTSGLTKTYEFASGTGNGTILSNGNIAINTAAANGTTMARIAIAINHANGHNGSITAASPGATLTNLTQGTSGANGNTIITTTLDSSLLTVTSFTGGTSTFGEARDLQVYLVRDSLESDNAKFVVKNQTETIYAESDFIYDIYDNDHYNIALRIKPQTYPYAGNVTNTTPDYDIELYAVSHNFDELREEILVSTTVNNTTGSAYLQAPKRIYAAAHYENFTGSVLHRTDLEFGRVSAWLDYLPNSSIQEHNKDVMNYGNHKSIDGSTAFAITGIEIPTMDLSILNWDFDTVTGSDSSGEFVIEDTTSGSSDTIYGWVDNLIRREHDGRGFNFPTSSDAFLENEFLYASKKQLPETSFNAHNIYIKGEQEINFGEDDDISDNLFVLEKSPAAIVSEEMLKLFSTTQEFSNLFGRHVDRYRIEYKDIAKARQLFHQRVETGLDFDKFFNYFKWIDQSISEMINQLIPASVNFAGGVVDVIEPHILERDKYQRQIGLLQTVTSTEASMRGVQELNYNWRIGHAPRPLDTTTNSIWQMERTGSELTTVITRQTDQEFTNPIMLSGTSGVISGSELPQGYATRRFSRPYRAKIEFADTIHGGTNYVKNKDRDLLRSGIGLHSDTGSSGAPSNIVTIGAGTGFGLNVEEVSKTQDQLEPSEKIRYDGFALFGKFTELNGAGYGPLTLDDEYTSRRKIANVFLGNIVSSSVSGGYNEVVSASFKPGVNIVNLHSDTTDISNEIAIQGPFTEKWVGGHQHRHTALNSVGKTRTVAGTGSNNLDDEFSRPEGYRLLLGKNPLLAPSGSDRDQIDGNPDDGALGFTAPDYGIGNDGAFPDEQRMYSIFYREERAKRPLNVKNIQTTTSSVYHGNYQHEYEVFSTFGDQGYFLKRAGNLLPESIASTLSETTNYATLIAQRAGIEGNTAQNDPTGEPSNRLSGEPARATIVACLEAAIDHSKEFTLTNAAGITITFGFNAGANNSTNTANYAVIGDRSVDIGTLDLAGVPLSDVAQQIVNRINAGTGLMDMTAELDPTTNDVIVTQGTAGSIGNKTNTDSGTGFTIGNFTGGSDGANQTATQDREHTGSAHVIRTQFSAPGGPEINSPAYLDVATQQFSVYNSINFRNLSVLGDGSGEVDTFRVNSHSNRREGLRTLRSRHQGQFGIDSQHGSISSADYDTEASFHKQHRNTTKIAKGTESGPVGVGAELIITASAEPIVSGDDNHRFSLTDADGVTTIFRITSGNPTFTHLNNTGSYTPGSTTDFYYTDLTTADTVRDSLVLKINAMNPPSFTASASGSIFLILTQNKAGPSGNTTVEFPDGSISLGFGSSNSFTGGINAPTSRHDNMHFNTPIPASDFQYSWINAAISGSNWEASQSVLTHAPRSGIISSSAGIDSAINFPTISDVECEACAEDFSLSLTVKYTLSGDGATQEVASDGSTIFVKAENDAYEPGGVWQGNIHLTEIAGSYSGCCTDPLEYKVTLTSGSATVTYGYGSDQTPIPSGAIVHESEEDNAKVDAVFFVRDCEGNEVSSSVTFDQAKLDTSP